jgi:hypothetical protein
MEEVYGCKVLICPTSSPDPLDYSSLMAVYLAFYYLHLAKQLGETRWGPVAVKYGDNQSLLKSFFLIFGFIFIGYHR